LKPGRVSTAAPMKMRASTGAFFWLFLTPYGVGIAIRTLPSSILHLSVWPTLTTCMPST